MLDTYQVIVLSVVQGLTEFLPVSSSAHLILTPILFGWSDQGLAFDIAVHLGTLIAVLIYFKDDVKKMLHPFMRSKLFWFIALGTIPVGLAGLLLKETVETTLRKPMVIALSTIGFGLVLWIADRRGSQKRAFNKLNWKDVFWVGCAQALSLIPGTSRSGITLTAGLSMGLTREAAARFSFLLSIPVIILAGLLETVSLVKSHAIIDWATLGLGLSVSAVTGYFCIHYFIKLINSIGLWPFIVYRLILGSFLLFYFY